MDASWVRLNADATSPENDCRKELSARWRRERNACEAIARWSCQNDGITDLIKRGRVERSRQDADWTEQGKESVIGLRTAQLGTVTIAIGGRLHVHRARRSTLPFVSVVHRAVRHF